MSFYSDKLAILPFKQDSTMDTTDNNSDARYFSVIISCKLQNRRVPYLASAMVPLAEIDAQLKNISDFCFLYDYFEPTLAILFEPLETWTGLVFLCFGRVLMH